MKHEGVGANILVHSVPSSHHYFSLFLIHQTEHEYEHTPLQWSGSIHNCLPEGSPLMSPHLDAPLSLPFLALPTQQQG